MLETRIAELTAAVEALTKAIGGMQAPVERPKVTAAEVSAEKDANGGTLMGAKERVIKAKEEVPNAKPKSEDTSSTSQASEPESKPVTYDDVKRATNAVSAKLGTAITRVCLQRFGAVGEKGPTATKLAETQWSGYVEYMTKVATGEIDPEASHE